MSKYVIAFVLSFFTANSVFAARDFRSSWQDSPPSILGFCSRTFLKAKMLVGLSPDAKKLTRLLGDKIGYGLGESLNDLLNDRTVNLQTGAGSSQFVQIENRPYAVEVEFVEAVLFTAVMQPHDFNVFDRYTRLPLFQVRNFLTDPVNASYYRMLIKAMQSERFLFGEKEYVIVGQKEVRQLNLETDLSSMDAVPSRENGITGQRLFKDGYAGLVKYEFQGNGRTGYAKPPSLEKLDVRVVVTQHSVEIGYIDGVYMGAIKPGMPRGSFRAYQPQNNVGHVVEVRSGDGSVRWIFVPDQGAEFFTKW